MTVTLMMLLNAVPSLGMIAWGVAKKERMVELPFFAGILYIGWVMPQLFGLVNGAYPLPPDALHLTLFMSALCMAALWYGYKNNTRPAHIFAWRYSYSRLFKGSVALSILGAFFYYKVSAMAPGIGTSQWSGIITIYAFFSKLMSIGFALALILYMAKPNKVVLAVILFDVLFYLDRILIKGRRAVMAEFGLMILLSLWFQRKKIPPRWLMVTVISTGLLLINSIGDYRRTVMGEDRWSWSGASLEDVLSIEFVDNFFGIFRGEVIPYELMNASMNIAATQRRMDFDYGLSLWNWMVQQYVPGQLIGYDIKRDLMFEKGGGTFGRVAENAEKEFGYQHPLGTTATGFSDAFQSFWFFGAVKFLLIGMIMSRWYLSALKGNVASQVVTMFMITPALHSITHSTHWFFMPFGQLVLFLVPVLLYAKKGIIKHPLVTA